MKPVLNEKDRVRIKMSVSVANINVTAVLKIILIFQKTLQLIATIWMGHLSVIVSKDTKEGKVFPNRAHSKDPPLYRPSYFGHLILPPLRNLIKFE